MALELKLPALRGKQKNHYFNATPDVVPSLMCPDRLNF
jgi:hypothetical protein